MGIVLAIIGIIVLGFVVNVAIKQSYNFLFFLGRKPLLWIIFVGIVAIAVWGLSDVARWGVSVPAWACTIALFMNLSPRQKSAEEQQAIQAMADEVYSEMGIRHGRLLYRLGLVVFVVACLASWVVFYG
jgi:hypothetical protein